MPVPHRLPLRLLGLVVSLCLAPLGAAPADRGTDQLNFAEGLFIHQDYRSAAEEFKRFAADYPNSEHTPAALYRVGEALLRLDKPADAATALQAALERFPTAKEAALGTYNLGRAHLRQEHWEQALETFQRVAATPGEVGEQARVGAGECLTRLNRLADAATLYAAFQKDFPQSKHRADVQFSWAWCLASLGRHAEAAEAYTALIRDFAQHPQIARARLALSDSYTALRDFAKSAQVLAELEGDKALAEDVLLRRAWNQFRSGDRKAAAASFRAFAERFPDSPQRLAALHNAGTAAIEDGQFADAAAIFAGILQTPGLKEDDPERTEATYWLGFAAFRQGQADEARRAIAPLLANPASLKPERRESLAFLNLQVLDQAGRPEDTVRAAGDWLVQYPDSANAPAALYILATAQEKAGQLTEAAASLDRLLQAFPQAPLRADALFALGEYAYRLKQPQRALAPLEELAAAANPSDKVRYRLGWVYLDLGRFDRSLAQFAALADMASPLAVEATYQAGRAAEQLKAADQAIAFYERLAARPQPDEFTAKALHRLGFLYEGDKARANADRYRQLFPTGEHAADLRLRLAEAAFAKGDTAAAQAEYTALHQQADLPAALRPATDYGLGWCLLRQGDLEAADACFARLPAEPLSEAMLADGLLQRGEIAYRRQQFEAARGFLAKLVDQPAPRGDRALYMQGWACRRLNDTAAATQAFQALLARSPTGEFASDAAARLGEALLQAKQYAEARTVLQAALDRPQARPEQEEDLLHLCGDALVALEDWKSAITTNQRLLERFPDSKRAYLAAFRLGLAHQAVGLHDQAEAHFRDTIAKTDTVEAAQAQFNLGAIAFSRQQYLEAAKNFLRVEMLYDYGDIAPKALYHAIDSFRRAGDAERAELYVQKLKEKYADSPWTQKAQAKQP